MPFPKPESRIPSDVEEVRIHIRQKPDGEGGFQYHARAHAEYVNEGGQRVDTIGADLIPLLSDTQKQGLLELLQHLRTLAQEQIDQNDG